MGKGIESEIGDTLFADVSSLIEGARTRVARRVNSELVMLYWGIGKRIREGVLGGERAEYGQAVVQRLSDQLTGRYGRGYGRRNLFRMMQFAECYPTAEIVSPLAPQLTWTNITLVLALGDEVQRRLLEFVDRAQEESVDRAISK